MTASAPNWDLTPFFTGADGADFTVFRDRLAADVAALRERAATLPPPGDGGRESWVALLTAVEEASSRFRHMSCYLACAGAADSRDESIRRETARAARLGAELQKLHSTLRVALGQCDARTFDGLVTDERLAPVRFFLGRVRERAQFTMAPALEDLAADLSVDGIEAWGRLYDRITGTLTFEHAPRGRDPETLPVSRVRSLLEDVDPEVRRAAQRGSAAAWERAAEPIAACLNAISGTRLALYRRRGIRHFLDPALFDAAIERETLDTLWAVVRERQGVAHRYLRAKAKHLDRERLGFQDLLAPLPRSGREARIPWEAAVERVRDAFAAAYPALGELAARAFAHRWIDHEPRSGKRPGGFCASSPILGESRIFLTHDGATGDVQTLAHELGHAFHSWLMRDMRHWARRYPMTLAETASTFGEAIVLGAALRDPRATDDDRRAILDHRLLGAATFLCNIPTRFDFEHEVYVRRAEGELSVTELSQIMLDAQRANYGDALDPEELDPWFWASKLHFYVTGTSFYNFPYTFGYLFSIGLFARFEAEGAAFLPVYERLLRATGSATAEEVAHTTLGVDLRDPAFWHASVDVLERDLERYLALDERGDRLPESGIA